MRLKWLTTAGVPQQSCYAAVTFEDIRVLTFRVIPRPPSFFEKNGKIKWVAFCWNDRVGEYGSKGQAQRACQDLLDGFMRELFDNDED